MSTNLPHTLLHDVEFDNAIFFRQRVAVYRNGECVESSGTIQRFTADSVVVRCMDGSCREAYYLRRLCHFLIRG
ncbi:hypothetical protein [Gorillibacterium timonense]|uniref:hypothetical protein n=1 Tax=Gorillibacterium timonense TaxID=1689269 RepID=UPI0011DE36F5|nr:hypothetical protein [Gorillibacterium timonense]